MSETTPGETPVERRLRDDSPYRVHHGRCQMSQAWDMDGVPCDCPPGWPRWYAVTEVGAMVVGKKQIAALLARCEETP